MLSPRLFNIIYPKLTYWYLEGNYRYHVNFGFSLLILFTQRALRAPKELPDLT